ncbi:hypothetical protein JCM8547_009317 [Rhodosporidiobolus lusitaniae]
MAKRTQRDDDYTPTPRASRPRGSVDGGSSATTGRKPGRTSVACSQCRQRKSNCSLSGPACEACMARGEGESCSFQALIWIDNADDLPSRQLKRKVDRLEELLKGLAQAPLSPSPPPSLPSPPPTAVPLAQHQRASSAPGILDVSSAIPRPVDRARLQACTHLTRIVLSGDDVPAVSIPGLDPAQLSFQLGQIEQQYAAALPLLAQPTPAGLHAFVSADEFEHGVRAVLPTPQQAHHSLASFFALANPFLSLLHPPTFLAQCEEFWRTGHVPEPVWLATYLLACGGGLAAASEAEAARGHLPTGEGKELLARTWLDAGRRVLTANGFLQRPTIEGIRALHLLLHWWVAEGGRYLEQALSLSSIVISVLFDMGLNRDPDEVAPHLDPVEADLRRRLFYSTMCFDTMVRGAIGHSYSPFDEDDISVRLPLDIGTESDIPSPHFTAAVLNFRINKLMSRIKMVTADEVARILDELESYIEPNAQDVLRFAMMRWGYVRLQRFAVKAGLTMEKQDHLAARYFEELSNSIDAASSAGGGTASLVLLKIFSLAISAAVDLSGMPFALASMNPTSSQLNRLVQDLRSRPFPRNMSRIVARGVTVLEHFLPMPEPPVVPPSFGSSSSEFSSFASSKLATPSTAGDTAEGFATFPPVPEFQQENYLPTPQLDNFAVPVTQYPDVAAGMPPPGPCAVPSYIRATATRPSLNVFTCMAPPAASTKAPTPIAISPWVDAAITPSRYVSNHSWERFL